MSLERSRPLESAPLFPSFLKQPQSCFYRNKVELVALAVLGTIVIGGALALWLSGGFTQPLFGRFTQGEVFTAFVALSLLGSGLYLYFSKPSSTSSPVVEVPVDPEFETFEVGSEAEVRKRGASSSSSSHEPIDFHQTLLKLKDLSFIFDLEKSALFNSLVREGTLRRLADRSLFLKHAKVMFLRVLADHPELLQKDLLPGLAMAALLVSIKTNRDARVLNKDFIGNRAPRLNLSSEEINFLERQFLGLLKWNTQFFLLERVIENTDIVEEHFTKLEQALEKPLAHLQEVLRNKIREANFDEILAEHLSNIRHFLFSEIERAQLDTILANNGIRGVQARRKVVEMLSKIYDQELEATLRILQENSLRCEQEIDTTLSERYRREYDHLLGELGNAIDAEVVNNDRLEGSRANGKAIQITDRFFTQKLNAMSEYLQTLREDEETQSAFKNKLSEVNRKAAEFCLASQMRFDATFLEDDLPRLTVHYQEVFQYLLDKIKDTKLDIMRTEHRRRISQSRHQFAQEISQFYDEAADFEISELKRKISSNFHLLLHPYN